MNGPVMQLFLRKNIEEARVKEIVNYMEKFGHGPVTVERFRREVILYLHDKRDIALIKSEFGRFIDAQMPLTT